MDAPDAAETSDRESLTPTFAPQTTATAAENAGAETTTGPPPAAPATAGTPPGGPPGTTAEAPPPPGWEPPPARGAIQDPVGDVTASALDRPPDWADLAGAVLSRTADRLELRVRLGAPAPAGSPDPDHTMNVAAFFDVDGDGTIDTEVWANLATGGWGGSWFDNDAGEARFVDESGVDATVESGELVLRFPASHVRGAPSFRWSMASEWGRYEVIGTAAAARDDAPDGDVPVDFPQTP